MDENKESVGIIKLWLVASASIFVITMLTAAYKKTFGGYLYIDEFSEVCEIAAKEQYGIPSDISVYISIPGTERMPRNTSLFSGALVKDRRIIIDYQVSEVKKSHSARCFIYPKTRKAVLLP